MWDFGCLHIIRTILHDNIRVLADMKLYIIGLVMLGSLVFAKDAPLSENRILNYSTENVIRSDALNNTAYNDSILTPSKIDLNEIVVSASKWNNSIREVSSKIVSVSRKEVQLQNPQTAADLLGVSGYVFIQKSQQGGGSPMIRGFAANRLLYLVDEVRMNNAIFRSGNLQNVINIDPFGIEKTEVLMGAASTVYGSDAIGGVMSFKTLQPKLSSHKIKVNGNAAVRTSSANKEKTGHIDINIGAKKWAAVTSISSWDYSHLKQGKYGPDDYVKPYYVEREGDVDEVVEQGDPLLQVPSAYSQYNVMQKIRFRPNTKWDLQYAFHQSETSPYGRYDRHNRVRNDLPRYAEWNYGSQKWCMNHLRIKNVGQHLFYDKLQISLAQQQFEESRISRTFNSITSKTQQEQVDAYSFNIDLSKVLYPNQTIYYGAEYVLNDIVSSGLQTNISNNTTVNGESRYPDAQWQSIAAYFNYNIKLSNKNRIIAGARYNHFLLDADFTDNLNFYPLPVRSVNSDNGAVSGNLGWIFKDDRNLIVKTNFGTAFRSPNVDDVGKVFDSSPGSVTVPNVNVKTEYAYTLDLGVTKMWLDKLKVDVAVYYTFLDKALVKRSFKLNGNDSILYDGVLSKVYAVQNAANARVYGLQAGFEFVLPFDFTWSGNFNVQHGRAEMDNGEESPSRHAAPFFGTTRLNYQKDKLGVQLYALFQGERKHDDLALEEREKVEIYALDSNGNSYAPSWYILNLKGIYALHKNISIAGGIENIFNRRYRPYSSGISGAGRNFVASLYVKF